jgi:hypothetical protein
MIEHWGGHGLVYLKSVISEYLSLIFIPNYCSFTTHRLKAFRLRISECEFRNYKEFITTSFGKLSFGPSAGAIKQAGHARRKVNPLLKRQSTFQKAQSSVLSPRYFFILSISLLLALGAMHLPVADAAQVTLGWDANSEPDLEGYVIYRNTGSPGPPYDYANTLPEEDLTDPLHPKITLTGLNEGQEHYIALTAYSTEGVESNFSNDVCVEVAGGSVGVCANSPNSGSSYSGGGGGSSNACFISNAGYDSSTFSKFVAQPVIRTQELAMLFLLLVFIAAVKFVINRTKG